MRHSQGNLESQILCKDSGKLRIKPAFAQGKAEAQEIVTTVPESLKFIR